MWKYPNALIWTHFYQNGMIIIIHLNNLFVQTIDFFIGHQQEE